MDRFNFNNNVDYELITKFHKYTPINTAGIKKIEVVSINNEAVKEPIKIYKDVIEMRKNTLQMPQVIKASKSVAGFHLFKGMEIGTKVSLRKMNAENYYNYLLYVVLPSLYEEPKFSQSQYSGDVSLGIGPLKVSTHINAHIQFSFKETSLNMTPLMKLFIASYLLLPVKTQRERK